MASRGPEEVRRRGWPARGGDKAEAGERGRGGETLGVVGDAGARMRCAVRGLDRALGRHDAMVAHGGEDKAKRGLRSRRGQGSGWRRQSAG